MKSKKNGREERDREGGIEGRGRGREKARGRERERDNMKNLNNRGILVKDKQKFLVLLLQLLCKFEILAKLKVPP